MTRDDIIRMAREAGFRTGSYALSNGDECVFAHPVAFSDCIPELERFAALVAAAERESWSNACDSPTSPSRTSNPSRSWITEHWIALQPSAQGGKE